MPSRASSSRASPVVPDETFTEELIGNTGWDQSPTLQSTAFDQRDRRLTAEIREYLDQYTGPSPCSAHNASQGKYGTCYINAAVTLFAKTPGLWRILSDENKRFVSGMMRWKPAPGEKKFYPLDPANHGEPSPNTTAGNTACPWVPPKLNRKYRQILRRRGTNDNIYKNIGQEGGVGTILTQALVESSSDHNMFTDYTLSKVEFIVGGAKHAQFYRPTNLTLPQMKVYMTAIRQKLAYDMQMRPGVYCLTLQPKKSKAGWHPRLTRALLHNINIIASMSVLCVGGFISIGQKAPKAQQRQQNESNYTKRHVMVFTMCRDVVRVPSPDLSPVEPFLQNLNFAPFHNGRGKPLSWQDPVYRTYNTVNRHPPFARMNLCNWGRCTYNKGSTTKLLNHRLLDEKYFVRHFDLIFAPP